jgi:DNA ligase-associated metallophosphoesterase
MVPVSFANQEWLLMEGRALYWPNEQALLIADLHLEKASFFARYGQPIPPYDSRETLERVALAVRETGARRVITLGDNFHDAAGASRLEAHAAGMLDALTKSLDWVWITGNHDEDDGHKEATKTGTLLGGAVVEEMELGGVILRHQAKTGEERPEISGHFHPKMRVKIRQRHIARPCAVVSSAATGADRMIMPAFGAFTGGMDAGDPAIVKALQPAQKIDAILPAAGKLARFPLWRTAA